MWFENLNKSNGNVPGSRNKLHTYRLYKKDFKTEPYLCKPMSFEVRKTFSNFRCGNSQLHIETGRYSNTPLESRTCNVCNNDTIEDEFHFLIQCNAYCHLRNSLYVKANAINVNFNLMTDHEKFLFLLSDENVCKSTASTLCDMFKERRTYNI